MLNRRGYVLLVLLLLASITISTRVSAQVGYEDSMREKMLLIAESYAAYRWKGNEWNIQHTNNNIHTPDADYADYDHHPLSSADGLTDLSHSTARWWRVWNTSTNKINIGIPYFWNGSTAIQANDLNPNLGLGLVPIGGSYFDQLVASEEEGLAAGDVTTEGHWGKDKEGKDVWIQDFSGPEVGVDCVGFINNTWELGIRAGTAATSGQTRAIQPETMRPGDILMKYGEAYSNDITGNHVMLFKEFCSENDPVCDDPTPAPHPDFGKTCNGYVTDNELVGRKFKVYESSARYGRVTESVWKIVCTKDYPVDAGLGNYPTKS